jgi:hypothetical protein
MILSEDEARKKQCRFFGPMKVAGHEGRIPVCVASDCMGWRAVSFSIPATHSIVNGKKITEAQPGKGYCGYAGKP